MTTLTGKRVLLTGASGGLGVCMARAMASAGARLALVAYPGAGLDTLGKELASPANVPLAITCDLRDARLRREVVRDVQEQLGGIDILVNNAGVEFTSPYHELREEQILEVLGVNLEAAMLMARLVLPGMLGQGSGHIVQISSLAGKQGPAYQEPYAASKAALIAFTSSLRASYKGTGVSASVVVPGFVEAGIYARLKAQVGRAAPAVLCGVPPERVARAVIQAIERDRFEVLVNRYPLRPVLALSQLFPGLGNWIAERLGTDAFFKEVVREQKKHD